MIRTGLMLAALAVAAIRLPLCADVGEARGNGHPNPQIQEALRCYHAKTGKLIPWMWAESWDGPWSPHFTRKALLFIETSYLEYLMRSGDYTPEDFREQERVIERLRYPDRSIGSADRTGRDGRCSSQTFRSE